MIDKNITIDILSNYISNIKQEDIYYKNNNIRTLIKTIN